MLWHWPFFTWTSFMTSFHKIFKLIFQKQSSYPRNICTEHWRKLLNLAAFLSLRIGLFQKKSPLVKKLSGFYFTPGNFWQNEASPPLETTKIMIHLSEILRPRSLEILHYFFLITTGNFMSFLINPWEFHIFNPTSLHTPPPLPLLFSRKAHPPVLTIDNQTCWTTSVGGLI